MAHEGGRIVAAAAGIPLVMDMRDPWSLVQRVPEALASPLWLRAARRLERRAAEAASLVVVNTEPHREALSGLYPRLSAPIITVTNGYDEEAIPESLPASRFIIAYAGAIYLDRDPRPLLRAAGQLVRQLQLTPKQFGIAFMGNHSYGGVSLLEMARSEGLEAFLELRASGSRREALEFLGRASVLVSLPQDSDMAIPSKVYEYMQFRAWILALAEPGSATARLLEGTAADVVQPHDVERMLTVLRHRYEEHAAGIRRPRLADDPRYGRKRQSQILLDALDQVLPPNVSRYVPSPSAEALV